MKYNSIRYQKAVQQYNERAPLPYPTPTAQQYNERALLPSPTPTAPILSPTPPVHDSRASR